MSTADIIVIGAGLAGLTFAERLKRDGHSVQVLECGEEVATSWRSRHPQLTLNTHRALSAMPGLAYPKGTPAFPKRQEVIQHLTEFASRNALPIRFACRVKSVDRSGADIVVKSTCGEFSARHLVVATGHDRVPFIPEWPGLEAYADGFRHAAQFGSISQYRGKDILVIGAGNSGFDVLNHLSRIETGSIWLSVRGAPVILPKRLFNIAVNRYARLLINLPSSVADFAISTIQRMAFGPLKSVGFSVDTKGGATRMAREHTAISVDNGAMAAIKSGRFKVVGPVSHFEIDRVLLADSTELMPDHVIAATGYRTGLEMIFPDDGLLDETGYPFASRSGQSKVDDRIWFAAMYPTLTTFFDTAQKQSEIMAKAVNRR